MDKEGLLILDDCLKLVCEGMAIDGESLITLPPEFRIISIFIGRQTWPRPVRQLLLFLSLLHDLLLCLFLLVHKLLVIIPIPLHDLLLLTDFPSVPLKVRLSHLFKTILVQGIGVHEIVKGRFYQIVCLLSSLHVTSPQNFLAFLLIKVI